MKITIPMSFRNCAGRKRIVTQELNSNFNEPIITNLATSFSSTSIDRKVAEGYAKNIKGQSILFKINIPAGTPCLDISKISTAPQKEEEILFGNSGKFVYNDIYYDNNSNRLIARGEYVPD